MLTLRLLLAVLHLALTSTTTQTVQANICGLPAAPTITAPTTGTTTATQTMEVDGTTATASTTVNIMDNGQLAASVVSDGSDAFSADVQLTSGSNALVAQVSNDCNQTASSSTVTVTYNPPPPPPPPPPKKTPPPVTPAPKVVSIAQSTNPAVILPEITAPTQALSGAGLKLTLEKFSKAAKTTTASSVFVTGTTGQAANVLVVVNGKVVADILSGKDGSFGLRVPLTMGKNKVEFTATLGDKSITKSLIFTRKAVGGAGNLGITAPIIYIPLIIVIIFWLCFFFILFWRRRKRREAQERMSNVPSSI